MVWAAEFVRVLAEAEDHRPRMEIGEKYQDYQKKLDDWWSCAQHAAAERAAGRAALLVKLPVSLQTGWERGSDTLEMAIEMSQDS